MYCNFKKSNICEYSLCKYYITIVKTLNRRKHRKRNIFTVMINLSPHKSGYRRGKLIMSGYKTDNPELILSIPSYGPEIDGQFRRKVSLCLFMGVV